MNGKPILVIMAAGMGSRYGGLKQIDYYGKSAFVSIYNQLSEISDGEKCQYTMVG
ncbi:hypothetical protein [Clostridium boliviensis]|uniref:hypothetical protein n=1 Tax=Clostridium boliviensis TaxID=318465 RepID=UPI0030143D91